ncbi:alpha/beta fold hydrolase [Kocuria koreensis]|uniref:Alpha/beta fold hydrolase n=1 Tax=Rothia koreensis TaxID=592378 RepID=A0A7K1LG89_9MICC|nr:alpha/beta fold hydrolase [Rothia koreensis]MUN54148.1 alpha/beta fold hydrolase [Rothia koreensis]
MATANRTTRPTPRPGPIPLKRWPGVARDASRVIDAESTAPVDSGSLRTWHFLDNGPELERQGLDPVGTILCVHGNPTWSYLWRNVVAAGANSGIQPWRVVAVDQLDMGYSERTGLERSLEDRVRDLGDFTRALGLDDAAGPEGVVTLSHDWGGLISQGWGMKHPDLHRGRIFTNTALHHAQGEEIPGALRLALHPAVHGKGTRSTTAFLDVTLSLHKGTWDPEVRKTFRSPYTSPAAREGIQNFVADIPVDEGHRSYAAMQRIAQAVADDDLPCLVLWGPGDPVFKQRYLDDILARNPEATLHRFDKAGHLVAEEEDISTVLFTWLDEAYLGAPDVVERHRVVREKDRKASPLALDYRPMVSELEERRDDDSLAVVDMGPAGRGLKDRSGDSERRSRTRQATIRRQLSWRELAEQVDRTAEVLRDLGVQAGTRVNLMVPPGSRLTTLIYACLKIGAVIVVADTGLGIKGLTRALRGASPEFLVGIPQALLAAKTAGWPGRRVLAGTAHSSTLRLLGAETGIESHEVSAAQPTTPWNAPQPDNVAAILYTSGSTGPAKGVAYTHRQLSSMRDAIQNTYGLGEGAGLVAGFAPFALLGPALGATSVTPDMDVTQPKTLTAKALAQAVRAISATVVFASPAALMNVVETREDMNEDEQAAMQGVERLLSAGAPITVPLLEGMEEICPHAKLHTPYGMTECLPLTDVNLDQIREAERDADPQDGVEGAGAGVCVGTPVYGARVQVVPLDDTGAATGEPTHTPGITGEIIAAAPHAKDHYDRLWWTERTSASIPGWHRTGDVGHFDATGRLWVEGRLSHLISTESGLLTPVAGETAAEKISGVRRAAVVGVGPWGAQVPVVVVERESAPARNGSRAIKDGPAPQALARAVRSVVESATGVRVAAILQVREHPTDIRHNSKIDRPRLAAWADSVLSGGKVRKP